MELLTYVLVMLIIALAVGSGIHVWIIGGAVNNNENKREERLPENNKAVRDRVPVRKELPAPGIKQDDSLSEMQEPIPYTMAPPKDKE